MFDIVFVYSGGYIKAVLGVIFETFVTWVPFDKVLFTFVEIIVVVTITEEVLLVLKILIVLWFKVPLLLVIPDRLVFPVTVVLLIAVPFVVPFVFNNALLISVVIISFTIVYWSFPKTELGWVFATFEENHPFSNPINKTIPSVRQRHNNNPRSAQHQGLKILFFFFDAE